MTQKALKAKCQQLPVQKKVSDGLTGAGGEGWREVIPYLKAPSRPETQSPESRK